jgi:hypothetical protein
MTHPILRIHTPGDIIDLLHGTDGIRVVDWDPSVAAYKDGGIWHSSPVADGRVLVGASYDSITQTITLSLMASSTDSIARKKQRLRAALRAIDEYWMHSYHQLPCFLEARAAGEANSRYAVLKHGNLLQDRRPFGSGFMQPRGARLEHELEMVLVHDHWREYPPPNSNGLATKDAVPIYGYGEYNGVYYGNMGHNPVKNPMLLNWDPSEPSSPQYWSNQGAPGVLAGDTDNYLFGSVSMYIELATTADQGIYQDIGSLQNAQYTISVWVRPVSGTLTLAVSNSGTFDSPQTATSGTATGRWERLTITRSVTGNGMRVALRGTTNGDAGNFDGVKAELGTVATEFIEPQGTGPIKSTGNDVFVGARHTEANLTHVYRFDGTSWSGNLLLESEIDSAIDPSIANYAIYFGIETDADVGSPFNSLVLNVTDPITGNAKLLWEYYDLVSTTVQEFGGFSPLFDGTNTLRIVGVNPVSWIPTHTIFPQRFGVVNLQTFSGSGGAPGVSGFWIRLRVEVASAGNDATLAAMPYAVQWPFVQVDHNNNNPGELAALARALIMNRGGDAFQSEYAPQSSTDVVNVTHGTSTAETGVGTLVFGGANSNAIGIRFPNFNVPPTSVITSARLTVLKGTFTPGVAVATVTGQATINPAAFTNTYSNYTSRPHTEAEVGWDLGQHSGPAFIASPDLRKIIGEIYQLGDRQPGDALVLFLEPLSDAVGGQIVTALNDCDNEGPCLEVTYITDGLHTSRVFMGSRSLERGERFTPYINLSDRQVPQHVTVETGLYTHFADTPESATGRAAVYFLDATVGAVTVKILPPLSQEYGGRYRVFVRGFHDNNIPARLRMAYKIFGGAIQHTPWITPLDWTIGMTDGFVADFGHLSIPSHGGNSGTIELTVEAFGGTPAGDQTSHGWLYDIVIMPVDEWAGDFGRGEIQGQPPTEDVLTYGEYTTVDSIDEVRRPAAIARLFSALDVPEGIWPGASSGEFTLIPHGDGRLWLMPFTTNFYGPQGLVSIKLWKAERYLSLRGDL